MGKLGRDLFDLNELPPEEEGEKEALYLQPQKSHPTTGFRTSTLFPIAEGYQGIINNQAFHHSSSGSGFQPFVRSEEKNSVKDSSIKADVSCSDKNFLVSVTRKSDDKYILVETVIAAGQQDGHVHFDEKEEGELIELESNSDLNIAVSAGKHYDVQKKIVGTQKELCSSRSSENTSHESGLHEGGGKEAAENCTAGEGSGNFNSSTQGDDARDCSPESSLAGKPKEVKGVEALHALRFANNPLKRPKIDEHKVAMLGKKRARQTMFINVEDAKQAGSIKTSTPRRQNSFPAPIITRTIKESHRSGSAVIEHNPERHSEITKDQKQQDSLNIITEENNVIESGNHMDEANGCGKLIPQLRSKKNNSELFSEVPSQIPRQGSSKLLADSRQCKIPPSSSRKSAAVEQNHNELKVGNKKHLPLKKQTSSNLQYQDTSVERLIREVTNDKFWHHPEESELQRVPGCFESVEEYVRVFEPLLFEECRAQLFSTWEELIDTVSRDAHIMVRVKSVERRERGWYDVVVLAVHDCKWGFKEGDVAVLSTRRPGTVKFSRRRMNGIPNEEDAEQGSTGRVAGTVRRYIPIDTRDPSGAILHFYVGESIDYNSKEGEDHVVQKLQDKGVWFLTVLGSLATTQREYVALHAFRRLSLQMQTAVLKPSPDHFPKYEEQPPAMPECFTPKFTDYLRKTFNGPQLAAIQWAAMHTAAGTSGGTAKRQDPWPFTLVQGPPGTGKTHTVWGMLNVIHLVQYQHYYTALLKKLAPESYKQTAEIVPESFGTGSIDEVLQSMDQNLLRTLPKLCPKPRMLVCAPSNAATDELLARVLDRGFIDGEMKVYRPDVARVGVDTQNRAAQAVSVERRTEQLLLKGRDEIISWLHHLKAREAEFSQQIADLQRKLSVAAAVGRAQGSFGVDPDDLAERDQNRDMLLQNLAAAVEGRDKVLVEMSRLLILEGRFHAGSNFNLEDVRASLEASFANEAEIVFTTVSSSGRKLFSRLTHGFDMVVIDEAAQASEVGVLPPLSLGAARCVLVGDPQQLPATVISKAAGTLQYSRSLFERFQQSGCPTILLSVQYRMHPQIRDFPSRYFYQGRLTDSDSVVSLEDEVYYKDPFLQPYVFYDIMHGRESHKGGSVSYQNIPEAQFTLRLYEHFQKFLKSNGGKKVSVGIITPYKLQLKCLQREFEEVLNSEEGKSIYINTVDAFQGQERDVVIMSCVRASSHGVGFVADIRRMNVALTRARRALWVVGNANALVQSDDWAALIADAKSRKCFMDMDSIPEEFLALKVSSHASGRPYSNHLNGSRTNGPRQRQFEMLREAKPPPITKMKRRQSHNVLQGMGATEI